MNEWEIAAVVLAALIVTCAGVCVLAGIADGLVALEVGGVLVSTVLMLLSEGLHRQPFVDLAIVSAALSLLAALVIVRLLEDTD